MNPKETVIVLQFGIDQDVPAYIVDQVTRAFRAEVEAVGLPLAAYSGNTVDEVLLAGCQLAHLSAIFADASCAARIAQRLNTDWLLLGTVGGDGRYLVRAQLVRAADMASGRVAQFETQGETGISAGVHRAWLALSSRP